MRGGAVSGGLDQPAGIAGTVGRRLTGFRWMEETSSVERSSVKAQIATHCDSCIGA